MINMTYDKESASKFITNVGVNEDKSKFVLTYGDGHTEFSDCVTDHNYNFYLNRLEQQFLDHKESYCKFISGAYMNVLGKRFVGTMITIFGIFLTCEIDIHIAMKIILSILIVMGGLFFRFVQQIQLMALDGEFDKVRLMEYLHKHKNEFYGKIVDEETGEVKEMQVINFNNIEMFNNPEGMKAMYNLLKYDDEEMPVLKK